MTGFVTKDSGKREDMSTGSRRDTQEGKTRPDLISPLVLRRLGMLYMRGAEKYGENNYQLGQKTSRYRASLGRHLLDYDEGLHDEDHLSAVVWNAFGIMMNQEHVERGLYPPEIDDHTDYTSLNGFNSTVVAKARAHNDELRDENNKNVVPDPKPTTDMLYDEDVDVPICFGDLCGTALGVCEECDYDDSCYPKCHECDFAYECEFVSEEVDDDPDYDNPECNKIYDKTCSKCVCDNLNWTVWPCCDCVMNPATVGFEPRPDNYFLERHVKQQYLKCSCDKCTPETGMYNCNGKIKDHISNERIQNALLRATRFDVETKDIPKEA